MFGTINNPLTGYGGVGSTTTGPVTFLSNIFQLVALAAGLFALFNLVIAGMQYISSQGDPQRIEKAQKMMTMSLIGLVIIVMAYAIAAILGGLLFGDPGFLFNPTITGPGRP